MQKNYLITGYNHAKFTKEIANASWASKLYAVTNMAGPSVTFHFNPALTAQEETEMDGFVAAHDNTPSSPIRVHRKLPKQMPIEISDFTILGFEKESPLRDRGRKKEASYTDGSDGALVVKKTFTDVWPTPTTLSIQCKFDWFDDDGNVAITKTEIVKKYNKDETETVMRDRRARQFDYLKGSVKDTPLELPGKALWARYDENIRLYIEDDSDDLHAQFEAETDPTTLAVLGTYVPRNDDPTKPISVRQAIYYQIGKITIAEIETENAGVTWPPAP